MDYNKIKEELWNRIEELNLSRQNMGLRGFFFISNYSKYEYSIAFDFESSKVTLLQMEDEWDWNFEMYTGNTDVRVAVQIPTKYFESDGVDMYYQEVILPEIKKNKEKEERDRVRKLENQRRDYEYLKSIFEKEGND